MDDLLRSGGIDWRDQSRRDELSFWLASPQDPTGTLGRLGGVDASGCSIDQGYYTDTRVSGKLRVHGGAWRRNQLVRITHAVRGTSWSEQLGTFFVSKAPGSWQGGEWVDDLELQSALWALGQGKVAQPLVVRAGSTVRSVMGSLLSSWGRPYLDLATSGAILSADIIYESGRTYLSVLYDLAGTGGLRLGVDGMGHVTLSDYAEPSGREPSFELDVGDRRGIVHDGISRESDFGDRPSQVVVHCKYTVDVPVTETDSKGKTRETTQSEQRELVGVAEVESGPSSRGQRGFALTDYVDLQDGDLATKTQAAIDEAARGYRDREAGEGLTWSVTTQYFPVAQGDVGTLVLPADPQLGYAGGRKVLVQSTSLDLGTMQLKLDLKAI